MTKNVLKIIAVFIIGTVGGIFADQILWPYFVERPLFLDYRLEQNPVYVNEQIYIEEDTGLQELINKSEKVVVGIRTKTLAGSLEGSGLIITSDGLIVTLADFFPKGGEVMIFFDDKAFSPEFIQIEEGLALVRIEQENLPTASFLDVNEVKLGKKVFLIGALLEKSKLKKIVNQGIVRYFDQETIYTNIYEDDFLEGSVLFDLEGNILGLNTIDKQGRIETIFIAKFRELFGF